MYKQAYYRGGAVMNKTKLQWEKLFSEDRERKTKLSYEIRNAFECDYDRIVGSSSVRRLQDKAQVFPLQENDFTRTRLTHSMEVSAIAEYSYAAEPPVQFRLSHLSRRSEPL